MNLRKSRFFVPQELEVDGRSDLQSFIISSQSVHIVLLSFNQG
jgi:hypothetical protein